MCTIGRRLLYASTSSRVGKSIERLSISIDRMGGHGEPHKKEFDLYSRMTLIPLQGQLRVRLKQSDIKSFRL